MSVFRQMGRIESEEWLCVCVCVCIIYIYIKSDHLRIFVCFVIVMYIK
jgi:hypothetical protein